MPTIKSPKRTIQVNIRFNAREYEKIKGLAMINGLPVHEYLRYLLILQNSDDKK